MKMISELLDSDNPPTLTLKPRPGILSIVKIRSRMRALPGLSGSRREAALGLLYLWHDHWPAAHDVAQAHEGEPDFDLLHAIGHRREGDYENSIYWFRAAGKHPAFSRPGKKWDPEAFVRAVQAKPEDPALRAAQAEEMKTFFAWLTAKA